MPSMCDTCKDPGHCCRAFNLDGKYFAYGSTRQEVQAQLNSRSQTMFRPLQRNMILENMCGEPHLERWSVTCTWLGADGRCTNYNKRPKVCRDYEPLSTSLCCHSPHETTFYPLHDEWVDVTQKPLKAK